MLYKYFSLIYGISKITFKVWSFVKLLRVFREISFMKVFVHMFINLNFKNIPFLKCLQPEIIRLYFPFLRFEKIYFLSIKQIMTFFCEWLWVDKIIANSQYGYEKKFFPLNIFFYTSDKFSCFSYRYWELKWEI